MTRIEIAISCMIAILVTAYGTPCFELVIKLKHHLYVLFVSLYAVGDAGYGDQALNRKLDYLLYM